MPTVEIRVVGTIGPLITAGLPEFAICATEPITVISGPIDAEHTFSGILELLVRHGARPVGARVFPDPPPG